MEATKPLLAPELRVLYQTVGSKDWSGSLIATGSMTRDRILAALDDRSLVITDAQGEQRSVTCGEILVNCNGDSALVKVPWYVGPVLSDRLTQPQFDRETGLLRAITVDRNNTVLMDAYMDQEAYDKTQQYDERWKSPRAVYFSRSRNKLWPKGDESGNVQRVIGCHTLTTLDAVRLVVEQVGGAACHDGYQSCFYRRLNPDGTATVIAPRIFDPKAVYKK